MKPRHPRRTQSQWAQLIEQQFQSGLTIQTFCEQNDIGLASFGKWKQRLNKKSTEQTNKSDGSLLQPIVIDEQKENNSSASGTTSVTLTLGSNITLTIESSDLRTS